MKFFRSGGKPLFDLIVKVTINLRDMLVSISSVLVAIVRAVSSIITALAIEIGPLLAPAAPASLAYVDLIGVFGFDQYIGYIVAGAIELIGLSSGATVIRVLIHNRRNRAEKNKIPPLWPYVSFAWYVSTIIGVVIFSDIASSFFMGEGQEHLFAIFRIFTKTFLALLSVPAIMVIAVRSSYDEFFGAEAVASKVKKQVDAVRSVFGEEEEKKGIRWGSYSQDDIVKLASASPKEAEKISGWPSDSKTNRNHRKWAKEVLDGNR